MTAGPIDLLVVADHAGGGLGASARAHAAWFSGQGWSVALAAPWLSGLPLGDVRAVPLTPAQGIRHVGSVARAASELRAAVRRLRPRVVHAHGTRSQVLCLLAGVRPYVTMHGSGGRVPGQSRAGAAARRLGRTAAPLLARGAYSAAPSDGRWRTTLHASPLLRSLDVLPPPPSGVPEFVWVGRLDVPKQPSTFIRACAIASADRAIRGVVVGDGILRDQLEAEAGRLGAPVTFVGETDDVRPRLARAWAVCLFSDFEGVPFSVQEAMWAGRAVVLSPLPSLRWFAGGAALFAADDEEAAAGLVSLSDPAAAAVWGERAGRRIRELLSPEDPYPALLADYGSRR